MAVLLLREEERKSQALSPEVRNLPRVTVRNQRVVAAPHWRGSLRARTASHVFYSHPEREEVWRESFERRLEQQTECGFHGPPYRPYRDVGQVELDDPRLILRGLGQNQDSQLLQSSPSPPPSHSPTHTLPPPPPRPTLRSMAPQLPEHVCLLPVEMREVEVRRGEVKVGRGLFESLSGREKVKAQDAPESGINTHTTGWQVASVTFDPGELSRRMSTVTFDPMNSSHDNRSRSERRGSHVTLDPGYYDNTTAERRMATDDSLGSCHDNRQTFSHNERPLTSESSKPEIPADDSVLSEELEREGEGSEEGVSGEGGGEGRGEEERSVLSQQSPIVHQWYRELCVLVWVMDGLREESTAHLPPFAKCWNINRAAIKTAHSLSVSRGKSPAGIDHTYSTWKTTTFPNTKKGSPQFDCLNDGHVTSGSPAHLSPSAYFRQKREAASREVERMRLQKKLTSVQMAALVKTVEGELDFSKKANRSRIQQLLQQTEQARDKGSPSSPPSSSASSGRPHADLSVERVQEHFMEAEQTKIMTVHHQLSAMERDRAKALEQRLVSLRARHSLWRDLSLMREGLEIETTSMARKKLLMNFQWFPDLLSQVPDAVQTDRYCRGLLDLLSAHFHHSVQVGPDQWSKRRLINILSTLRPWELRSPETASAVKFLIEHVIYILPEDYDKWLAYHTHSYMTRNNARS